MSIWPELDTISQRSKNPEKLDKRDAEILNTEIYPYWMDKTVLEVTRTRLRKEKSQTLKALGVMERLTFFMSGMATVLSHTTPFYEKVLEKGLNAMCDEARQKEEALTAGAGQDQETWKKIPGKVGKLLHGFPDFNPESRIFNGIDQAPTDF